MFISHQKDKMFNNCINIFEISFMSKFECTYFTNSAFVSHKKCAFLYKKKYYKNNKKIIKWNFF